MIISELMFQFALVRFIPLLNRLQRGHYPLNSSAKTGLKRIEFGSTWRSILLLLLYKTLIQRYWFYSRFSTHKIFLFPAGQRLDQPEVSDREEVKKNDDEHHADDGADHELDGFWHRQAGLKDVNANATNRQYDEEFDEIVHGARITGSVESSPRRLE